MYKLAAGLLLLGLAWKFILQKEDRSSIKSLEEYDYIVVGAGSAGGVVSARLSEDAHHTVALLEAGPDNDDFPQADTPSNAFSLLQTDLTWQYESEPQEHCCKALVDKKVYWPRGRGLGGTSLINAMVATRGSRHDYDLWAAMGNTEWSYEKVLPYFKKLETVRDDNLKKTGYRGTDGPINIEEPDPFPELTDTILNATESQGMRTLDVNVEDMIGFTRFQANQDHGVRESTARAYIKPAMRRSNLHVMTKAHATKVFFEGRRAVAVQYMQDGNMRTVRARKEIILSAGTIASPQLLMLSGIGPKEHLEEMNIPVIADLPVGKNLQDHVFVDALVYTIDKPICQVQDRIGLMAHLQYKLFGTGPLTTCGAVAIGYSRSKLQPENKQNPFIQTFILGTLLGSHPEGYNKLLNLFNMEPKLFEALNSGYFGRDGITSLSVLLQPYSRGEIRLRSENPFHQPVIKPNYLSDERDVKILLEGIRSAQKILEQPAMKAIGAKRLERRHPHCEDEEYDSDQYWTCFIRSNTLTFHHSTSTCKMGPEGDPTAVVDQDLRVKNVEGLRVADASIMPHIPSANTNLPCMMIGEKAADVIKRQS